MKKSTAGFTLLELSIVLVIIGLIVGGVLVGQDLIKAAEIRATVGQYEKYNSAINTFRTKYNGMPGDLYSSYAASFGLYTGGGTTGLGDGNGLITDTAGNAGYNVPVGETIMIWRHLSEASLIDGSYGTNMAASGVPGASPVASSYLPAAKMGRGNMWIAGSNSGLNYYGLLNVTGMTTTYYTTNDSVAGGAITPIEAYNIDVKVDDGLPVLGVIQARGVTPITAAAQDYIFPATGAVARSTWLASPTAGTCTTGGTSGSDTAATYARTSTPGNAPACALRLRFN